jgi:hypothetical protein
MQILNRAKRNVLILCLLIAPLFQLIGDILWINHGFSYSWSIWREASFIFFIPVGFWLAKVMETRSVKWALVACAFYVVGCLGVVSMMPLFRLGAFYPIQEHHEFPKIVQSVLDKNAFAVTLFPPGMCFPVSLILFGIGFLKYKLLNTALSLALVLSGILFWLGNAMEMDAILVIGDVWLLGIFCSLGYRIFRNSMAYEKVESYAV